MTKTFGGICVGSCVVALAALSGNAFGAGEIGVPGARVHGDSAAGVSSAGAERRVIRVAGGRTAVFAIADPTAEFSEAWRLGDDLADKHGTVPPPADGYGVTNRVIVESDDVALVELAAGVAPRGVLIGVSALEVRAHGSVDGFVVIEAGSVGQALDLADELRATGAFASVEADMRRPRTVRAPSETTLSDGTIWHLRNLVTPIADVNADGAWDMGYTGVGVTIGIVEGGFQQTHPDLQPNFSPAASMFAGTTSHATSCAGIAAAVGNNAGGAVGLAYEAQISEQNYGITDADAAEAFAHRNDLVDIKSNSWGPSDIGWIAPLSAIERAAIEDAVMNGRGGLGTIFGWAAGNGKSANDRADYDGYAASRYTFAIGSIGDTDLEATYSEPGSSLLAVTHSDGDSSPSTGFRGTYTTTSGGGYTSGFGGTSSASPLACGAMALALDANPNLTWRDMMHLIVQTSRKNDPSDPQWGVNGAGHDVNEKFGFGAIDAGALCAAASAWTNVGPEVSATSGVVAVGETVPDNDEGGLTRGAIIAENVTIETVEVIFNATTTAVGDLQVVLTSPSGTVSVLAATRNDPQNDYEDYVFMSMRCFGESSAGEWTLRVVDGLPGDVATWEDFEIRVYGTGAGPCSPADLDGDGDLDGEDIDAFVDAFLDPGSDDADLDGDGDVDIDDISGFTSAFLAGCA